MVNSVAGSIETLPAGPVVRIIVSARGVERVETLGSLSDQAEGLRLGQAILPGLSFVDAMVSNYRPRKVRRKDRRVEGDSAET